MNPAGKGSRMPVPSPRNGVPAHGVMPAILLVLAAALAFHAPASLAQAVTASLWSELGPNSASNGGISQDPLGVDGGQAIAINASNGDIYVAWTSADLEIYVSRWNGSAWVAAGASSNTGGGVSNSPTRISHSPRLAVRASDGHVFLVWFESYGDSQSAIHAAEFDGTQWVRLGANDGRVSDIGGPNPDDPMFSSNPDIVLSSIFASVPMPIVAWEVSPPYQNGDAIYVKRWTGQSWVELGTGSASMYEIPAPIPPPGQQQGPPHEVLGINADEPYGSGGRLNSSSPRLLLDALGKPAVVFLNGKEYTDQGSPRYPYGLHVRRFTGDNSKQAYLAWEDLARIESGSSDGGEWVNAPYSVAGMANAYSLHIAATVANNVDGPLSLKVLKYVGSSWSALPALDADTDPVFGFAPSLALRRDGNLIVAWQHITDFGSNADIYVRQSANIGGVFGWAELGGGSASANGISNNPSFSSGPAIALDSRSGNDVAVVAWSDGDTPDNEVFQIYLRQAQAISTTLPILSITDTSVLEGNTGARNATFTVGLSQPAGAGGVSFSVVTGNAHGAGNAAQAGSDYAASGPLPVNIPFGQASATFSVKVFGDTTFEADEVFSVRVLGLVGASMADDSAAGIILNDDARPSAGSQACQQLAAEVKHVEMQVVGGALREDRGLRRLLEAEARRRSLGCR